VGWVWTYRATFDQMGRAFCSNCGEPVLVGRDAFCKSCAHPVREKTPVPDGDDLPDLYDEAEDAGEGEPYDKGPGHGIDEFAPGGKRAWTTAERGAYLQSLGAPRRFDRSLDGPPLIAQVADAESFLEQAERDFNEATEEWRVASRAIEAEHMADRALNDGDQVEYEGFLQSRLRWESARVAYEGARSRLNQLLGAYDVISRPDPTPVPAEELSIGEYEKFSSRNQPDRGREASRGFQLGG
jgi:hypothetical protein